MAVRHQRSFFSQKTQVLERSSLICSILDLILFNWIGNARSFANRASLGLAGSHSQSIKNQYANNTFSAFRERFYGCAFVSVALDVPTVFQCQYANGLVNRDS